MTATQTESQVDSLIGTMRVGFTGGMYPVPADVPAEQWPDWQLTRAAELGCTALQIRETPRDRQLQKDLRRRAEALDIELEGSARGIFVPLAATPGSSTQELREQVAAGKAAGMTVLRSGYGRLTLETTRYAAERNAEQQLSHMVACLREAAKIAEEYEMPLAVENHCDFTGRELATVLREVDSEWIGCAMDTANGFTVYCDPNDDIEALAEFTFTTHMKDMRMVPTPMKGLVPIVPKGCELGAGHVDLVRAVRLFAERSPRAQNLHLITEAGWETFDPEADNATDLKKALLEQGVSYLTELVAAAKAKAA
ncbi:sugar phosphate isomerase/epimerase [Microlunatus sp. Gsoil 973]|uniref:sugar phosphate isomerase/epimerase family protein n=1 Tax=Microlunatus sp. Gsoil 973 TaxID=2672569 RepID=UPI0018A80955|nr:TIM barrel protein [Microlunatus sp. Gsoil 973]